MTLVARLLDDSFELHGPTCWWTKADDFAPVREPPTMQALMTFIVTWLSINFGLPANYELPQVAMVTPEQMIEVRFERGGSEATRDTASAANTGFEAHAVYDDLSQTIYLAQGWSAAEPADASVLVHELVHHLQNVGELRFSCAGEREKLAYQAQARWLEQVNASLKGEFEIDAMTVLVRSNCMF